MKAHPGDWIIMHSHTDGGPTRKAEVIATGADGAPPYTVRWIEDDRESVVFPGPDAHILTAEQQAAHDRAETEQIRKFQSALGVRIST
jgi:hypothetical protein